MWKSNTSVFLIVHRPLNWAVHLLSGTQAAQLLSPWACTRVSPVSELTHVLAHLTCWLVQGTMGFRWEMVERGLLSAKIKKWEGASCFPSPASFAQKALLSWVQSGGSCSAWLGRATDASHLLAGLGWVGFGDVGQEMLGVRAASLGISVSALPLGFSTVWSCLSFSCAQGFLLTWCGNPDMLGDVAWAVTVFSWCHWSTGIYNTLFSLEFN